MIGLIFRKLYLDNMFSNKGNILPLLLIGVLLTAIVAGVQLTRQPQNLKSTASDINLLSNPSFETGISPWSGWQAKVTEVSYLITSPHSGKYSAKVGTDTGVTVYTIDNFPGEVPYPKVGQVYKASVWVKGENRSVGKKAGLTIREHNSDMSMEDETTIGGNVVTLTNQWQQLTGTHTIVNSNMSNLDIYVYGSFPSEGDYFYVDDFLLTSDAYFASPTICIQQQCAAPPEGCSYKPDPNNPCSCGTLECTTLTPTPTSCIQVVTYAIDPNTGFCKEYPTPCDVPGGWKTVETCSPPTPTCIAKECPAPPYGCGYKDGFNYTCDPNQYDKLTCGTVVCSTPTPTPNNCLQVVTYAIDPNTGFCKEYPTPCDVPTDWKMVDQCPITIDSTPTPSTTGSSIKITAYGEPALGVNPKMQLRIDGKAVKAWSVGTTQKVYSYAYATKLRFDQIRVAFVNDYFDGIQDRNLNVIKINLDGIDKRSDDPSVYSTGTWGDDGDCIGYKQSVTLHCNGYFQY